MSFRGRILIYLLVAVPIPVISGYYFGNWREIRYVWLAAILFFILIEISQRWKLRRK